MVSESFIPVWLRRGKFAIAAVILREKNEFYDALVYVNGAAKEYTVSDSEFKCADRNYWEHGLITNWPVHPGLCEGYNWYGPLTEDEYFIANQLWYPHELTAG